MGKTKGIYLTKKLLFWFKLCVNIVRLENIYDENNCAMHRVRWGWKKPFWDRIFSRILSISHLNIPQTQSMNEQLRLGFQDFTQLGIPWKVVWWHFHSPEWYIGAIVWNTILQSWQCLHSIRYIVNISERLHKDNAILCKIWYNYMVKVEAFVLSWYLF